MKPVVLVEDQERPLIWIEPEITGDTLRRAIDDACPLVNPRLSEVDWDAVAERLRDDK